MSEVYVNLTNSQWHLALLAFLVLVSAPAASWPQRGFDTLVLLVSGLSGPFSPVLLPVGLLWCWRQRDCWQVWRCAIILMTAAVQLSLVYVHQSSRAAPGYGLGWSLHRLLNIVDVNILGVAAFGRQAMISHYWLVGQGWLSNGQPLPTITATGIFVGALMLAVMAFLRGPWVLRAFLIFAGVELASSLIDGIAPGEPTWEAMEHGIGMRYFFHPIAAWLAILATLLCDRNLLLRAAACAVMVLAITVALPADWQLPKVARSNFHREAIAFDRSPPGTVMTFPVRPAFLNQSMVIVKQ